MSAAGLAAARPLPPATWRTAGWLVGRTLRILAVVAPLVLLLSIGVAPVVLAYFAVESQGSLWSFAVQQAFPVFALAIGAVAMAHLPVHLAFGMTRRSFAVAVVLTVLAIAAVVALLVPLGFALEGARFRGYGWAHEMPAGFGAAMLIAALRTTVWGLVGALNAALWYRFGGVVGVLLTPFTVLAPLAAAAVWIERAAPFGPGEAGLLVGLIAVLVAAYGAVVLGASVKGKAA